MDRKNIAGLVVAFFVYAGSTKAQENIISFKLIQKIDSIAKAENITQAEIKTFLVSSRFDNTATDDNYNLSKKDKFYFDGPFIVIDGTYFNVNKLLYFRKKANAFVFFFQGY